jgi:hypothetical protein
MSRIKWFLEAIQNAGQFKVGNIFRNPIRAKVIFKAHFQKFHDKIINGKVIR